jgi:endonuclease YncB( thermonuclease family)
MSIKKACRREKAIMPLMSLFILALLLLLSAISAATLDEAYGTVTNVVDGDTFDVTIEKASPKVSYAAERIRLADVDSPEMDSDEGLAARDFTYAVLMNKRVYLDIDDQSSNGRDSYGRLICLVYLAGFYGQPISAPNFNRLLIDSGHARLDNFTNNEFDPGNWKSGKSPSSLVDTEDEESSLGEDLKRNITEEIIPEVQQSAEKALDRMAKDIWEWIKKQLGI